jgi:hypothetical protein
MTNYVEDSLRVEIQKFQNLLRHAVETVRNALAGDEGLQSRRDLAVQGDD